MDNNLDASHSWRQVQLDDYGYYILAANGDKRRVHTLAEAIDVLAEEGAKRCANDIARRIVGDMVTRP